MFYEAHNIKGGTNETYLNIFSNINGRLLLRRQRKKLEGKILKLEDLQKVHTTKAYILMLVVCLLTLKIGAYVLIFLVPMMLASFMESDEIIYKIRN